MPLRFQQMLTCDYVLQGGQLDVKYVLLFFYYGGMVHTCLHDYLKSLLCFTVVGLSYIHR